MTQPTNDAANGGEPRGQTSADRFRMGRLAMGWSEAELARTIAVPEQTVRDWECGKSPIPPKIAAWVGMYGRRSAMFDAEAV